MIIIAQTSQIHNVCGSVDLLIEILIDFSPDLIGDEHVTVSVCSYTCSEKKMN